VLDYLNTYGVRFLYPFSGRWFYGDTLFIMDPWVWIALTLGIVFARVQRRRGNPRADRSARVALAGVAAYIAVMMGSSFAGRGIVRRAARRAGLHVSGRVLVAPLPLVPHRRMVVVEEGDAYRYGDLRWTPRPVVGFAEYPRPVNDGQAPVVAAKRLRPIRQFLVWSRLPYFDVWHEGASAVVEARDARYPGRAGSWAAAAAVVPAKPPEPAPPLSFQD
jgi:inner membrane protein